MREYTIKIYYLKRKWEKKIFRKKSKCKFYSKRNSPVITRKKFYQRQFRKYTFCKSGRLRLSISSVSKWCCNIAKRINYISYLQAWFKMLIPGSHPDPLNQNSSSGPRESAFLTSRPLKLKVCPFYFYYSFRKYSHRDRNWVFRHSGVQNTIGSWKKKSVWT